MNEVNFLFLKKLIKAYLKIKTQIHNSKWQHWCYKVYTFKSRKLVRDRILKKKKKKEFLISWKILKVTKLFHSVLMIYCMYNFFFNFWKNYLLSNYLEIILSDS